MQTDFFQAEFDQPHPERTRAILRAHPEVRQLIGRNAFTAVIMLTVLGIQTALAFAMGRLGPGYWWLSLTVAVVFGAFMNHCMYVIIHDATHNLILKRRAWNKWIAILADLPNLVPGAIGFGVTIGSITRIRATTITTRTSRAGGKRASSATNGIARRSGFSSFPSFN